MNSIAYGAPIGAAFGTVAGRLASDKKDTNRDRNIKIISGGLAGAALGAATGKFAFGKGTMSEVERLSKELNIPVEKNIKNTALKHGKIDDEDIRNTMKGLKSRAHFNTDKEYENHVKNHVNTHVKNYYRNRAKQQVSRAMGMGMSAKDIEKIVDKENQATVNGMKTVMKKAGFSKGEVYNTATGEKHRW